MAHTYNSLFLVTVIAVLSPWLSVRVLRGLVPAIVIEILLGIAIGPSLLHIADSTSYVDFLGNFGFSYLMFLSGLELDFTLLFDRGGPAINHSANAQAEAEASSAVGTKGRRSRPAWLRGILFFTCTFVLSLLIGFLLQSLHLIAHPFVVAMVLSTTSTGIVTPALKEKGWLSDPFGQEVLLYALMADIATLLLITAYLALHTTGNGFSVLLVMVLLLVFVVIYRLLLAAKRFRRFAVIENATSELGLRGAFALILMFLALAVSLGTEVVVGAFLAGAIVSLLSERHSLLTRKLNSIGYGFLLPIFFVNVGLKFSVHALAASSGFWIMLLVLLVGMYLNKILPAFIFFRHFPFAQRTAGGVLLASRLSLIIAASQISVKIGVLTATSANGFILLAIVTCLISPALFERLQRRLPHPLPDRASPSKLTIDAAALPIGWEVAQIEVLSHRMNQIPMRNLGLPQDVLFVSVIRGDERIIPRGHTRLEQFDVVQVMGDPMAIDHIRNLFEAAVP